MTRTLLIGRAGAGKSHRVVLAVRTLLERGDRRGRFGRFVVLVPTYSQAEHVKRRLLRGQDGLPALLDRGIGTFEQLAERETGIRLHGLAAPAVQDALLRRALDAADVPAFRSVTQFPGFRSALLRLVKEIKSSEIEPGPGRLAAAADRIAAAAAGLPPTRAEKVAGIARVLTAYQEELSGAGLLDHGDLLHALLLRLRARDDDRRELVAVDGFTDLTQVQERIVQLLVERSDHALVTLLDDPAGGDADAGPFGTARALRGQLVAGSRLVVEEASGGTRLAGDRARVERVAAGEPPGSADPGADDPGADDPGADDPGADDPGVGPPAPPDGSVRLVAGADPADEADRIARLCRRFASDGIPRRDILVVVRRMRSTTGTRVLAALRRHGVPHRALGGTPLLSVPVACSALRLLRLLVGDDDPDAAVLALGAGDARGVPDGEADRVVQAARERGTRSPPELHALAEELDCPAAAAWLAELRAVRARALPEEAERLPRLEEPDEAHRDLHRDARDGVRVALEHLSRLLAVSFEGAATDPEGARAAADATALRRVRDLVAEALTAERVAGGRATALDVMRAATSAAEWARTRPLDRRLDAVNVVDAEEARTWEASVVLVAGLRMGEFPAAVSEDVFVGDDDRDSLRRATGVRLPARRDRALRRERLLFYSAVTRATDVLVLSTSMTNERGERAAPSPFLAAITELFPAEHRVFDGAERAPGDVRPAPGETCGSGDLLRSSLAALSEQHPPDSPGAARQETALAVLQEVVSRAAPGDATLPRRHPLVRAARARFAAAAELPEDGRARMHLAVAQPRSPSSLQDAAQCAYRYFARKGLALEKRPSLPEDGVDVLTLGSIAHASLEALYGAQASARRSDAAIRAVVAERWDAAVARVPLTFSLARTRERVTQHVIDALHDDASSPPLTGTIEHVVEMPFGGPRRDGAPTPPVAITAPDGTRVEVLGIVDRIDVDAGGRAVVLDYKLSSSTRYAHLEDQIAAGVALQLPLYAMAARATTGFTVLGAAFLTLTDRKRRWLWIGPAADAPKRAVVWSDDADARFAAVAATVARLNSRIRSGQIAVAPLDRDRCGMCSFADLCRVEELP